MTTTEEKAALNRRVEAALGDDLSCFRRGVEIDDRVSDAVRNYFSDDPSMCQEEIDYAWSCGADPDLLDHVRSYRAAPRPFCDDLNLCRRELWPKIREAVERANPDDDYSIWLGEYSTGKFEVGAYDDGGDWLELVPDASDTPELAIVRAFLAVMEKEGGTQ